MPTPRLPLAPSSNDAKAPGLTSPFIQCGPSVNSGFSRVFYCLVGWRKVILGQLWPLVGTVLGTVHRACIPFCFFPHLLFLGGVASL